MVLYQHSSRWLQRGKNLNKVLWNGSNLDEVKSVFPDYDIHKDDRGFLIFIGKEQNFFALTGQTLYNDESGVTVIE